MTLRVIGNTTRDIFYLTQNFPVPGESVLAAERKEDVGGKGFNQAVAAVRAGAKVCFTTAVGNDASAAILRTAIDAVEGMLANVLTAPFSTDESVIMISDDSENAIVSTAACARWLDVRSLAPTLESVTPRRYASNARKHVPRDDRDCPAPGTSTRRDQHLESGSTSTRCCRTGGTGRHRRPESG